MTLSEEQIKIIADNPLHESLNDVRGKLRDCADAPQEAVVSTLLGVLLLSPAAFCLSPPDGKDNVASRLLYVRQTIREINPEALQALVLSVSAHRPDADIWAAVINLI